MKKVAVGVLVLLLAGCNTVPEKLAVSDTAALTSYQSALDLTAKSESQARWGGRIAAIENRADSTVLDVVNFTLKANGRPKPSDATEGRFRLYMQGFLDPAIYTEGRLVTAVGKVGAPEQVKVGEYKLKQAVIYGQELHLWSEPQEKAKEYIYVPYVIRTPIYVPR